MKNIKIAIVSSQFRKEVTDNLEKNCITTLTVSGIDKKNISQYSVPGAFEIPLVVKKLAQSKKFNAIVTFGAIVKGKTYHFEQLANEISRALMQIMLQYEIPIIFEVLAVYRLKDALDRATRIKENKGIEAAETTLRMIKVLQEL